MVPRIYNIYCKGCVWCACVHACVSRSVCLCVSVSVCVCIILCRSLSYCVDLRVCVSNGYVTVCVYLFISMMLQCYNT